MENQEISYFSPLRTLRERHWILTAKLAKWSREVRKEFIRWRTMKNWNLSAPSVGM